MPTFIIANSKSKIVKENKKIVNKHKQIEHMKIMKALVVPLMIYGGFILRMKSSIDQFNRSFD